MRQLTIFKNPPLDVSYNIYNGEHCIYFRYKTQTGWKANAVTDTERLITPLYEQLVRMAFVTPNHVLPDFEFL